MKNPVGHPAWRTAQTEPCSDLPGKEPLLPTDPNPKGSGTEDMEEGGRSGHQLAGVNPLCGVASSKDAQVQQGVEIKAPCAKVFQSLALLDLDLSDPCTAFQKLQCIGSYTWRNNAARKILSENHTNPNKL